MIITKAEDTLNTNSDNPVVNFAMIASSKAFRIMSKNLYKYPVRAIVRELSTNAIDAHIMAGTTDIPFEITLPTALDTDFKIRDYGTGIDPDKFAEIAATYFGSTKEETNDQIGALGLGMKSPFGYTDAFSIYNYWNGRLHVYSMFMGDDEPKFIEASVTDTDEPNGLCVVVPTNGNDVGKWQDAAKYVLKFFGDYKPKINIDIEYLNLNDEYTIVDRAFPKVVAVMGHIPYEIPLEFYDNTWLGTLGWVYINFDMGSVDFMPSREELHLSEKTVAEVKRVLSRINSELSSPVIEKFKQAKTGRESARVFKTLNEKQRRIVASMGTVGKFNPQDQYELAESTMSEPTVTNGRVYHVYSDEYIGHYKLYRSNAHGASYRLCHYKSLVVTRCVHVLIDDTDGKSRVPLIRALATTHPELIGGDILCFHEDNQFMIDYFKKRFSEEHGEIKFWKTSELAEMLKALPKKRKERKVTERKPKEPSAYHWEYNEEVGKWVKSLMYLNAREIRSLDGLGLILHSANYLSLRGDVDVQTDWVNMAIHDIRRVLGMMGCTSFTVIAASHRKYAAESKMACAHEAIRDYFHGVVKGCKSRELGYSNLVEPTCRIFSRQGYRLKETLPEFVDKMYGRWYDQEKHDLLTMGYRVVRVADRDKLTELFTKANERICRSVESFKEKNPLLYWFAYNMYSTKEVLVKDFVRLMK